MGKHNTMGIISDYNLITLPPATYGKDMPQLTCVLPFAPNRFSNPFNPSSNSYFSIYPNHLPEKIFNLYALLKKTECGIEKTFLEKRFKKKIFFLSNN